MISEQTQFRCSTKASLFLVGILLLTVSLQVSLGMAQTVSFDAPANYSVGIWSYPESVAISDFNRDGNTDLATANNGTGDVSILLGTGSGTFGVVTNYAAGLYPKSVAIADFNRDGNPDLAIANAIPGTGAVSILIGLGDGTFGAATSYPTGLFAISVASGDFNGDGNADLAVANGYGDDISILMGIGDGTLGMATNYALGSSTYAVTTGDFNGDGKSDLAVGRFGTNVSILLATGAGVFGTVTNYAVGGDNPYSVAIGDFNRDGRSDLAVANIASDNLSILIGTGSGTFGAASNYAVGIAPSSVAIGDFNRDGKVDLSVASSIDNNVLILLGTGSGTFTTATNYPVGSNPSSVAIGDFNGDGQDDMAVANRYDGTVSIALNNSAPLPVGMVNISTRAYVGTGLNVEVGGFIISGTGSKTVLIRGFGPSMSGAPFNYAGTLADPRIELYSFNDGAYIATNNDWQNQSDLTCSQHGYICGSSAAIVATGLDPCQPNSGQTVAPPNCSKESALLIMLPPGSYTVRVTGINGGSGIGRVGVNATDGTTTPKLLNISTRAYVGTGLNVEVGGFIISGTASKTVLIRGFGPSMSGPPFNYAGTLADPQIELYSFTDAAYIAVNNDWQDQSDLTCSQHGYACGTSADIVATGLDLCLPNSGQSVAPTDCTKESALLVTLPPGSYSVRVTGMNGVTGIGRVGINDMSP